MAARSKKNVKPRLEFSPEEDDNDTETVGQPHKFEKEEETLRYSSLMNADCHWQEHEGMSSHYNSHEAAHKEAKERPSVTATAGRGVFATKCYTNKDCGNFTFKVILLGNASVGKTCLANLYINGEVKLSTQSTIAFDCKTKELVIDGVPSTLQIWDTAGMEQFRRGLINQYYRNLDGVIFVYDITKKQSFEDISEWYTEMRRYSRNNEGRIKMLLLGNKSDLEEEREVPIDVARTYAETHNMDFTEISAKDKDCLVTLNSTIEELSQRMLTTREENSLTRSMHDVIRLEGHLESEWVIVDEAPQGPFSQYNNCHPKSARMELGESFRKVFSKPRARTASFRESFSGRFSSRSFRNSGRPC